MHLSLGRIGRHLAPRVFVGLAVRLGGAGSAAAEAPLPTLEGDFVEKAFRFLTGKVLPKLRLHYTTLGRAHPGVDGRVDNAVLVLHGTGGDGRQFLRAQFADELFGPGKLLDITKYLVIFPDGIGHGKSSKPSDGLHARCPKYGYADMVAAQHLLLTDGLKVNHLRLIKGTSVGCMHGFVWREIYPTFMDVLMLLACLPVQIAGRNRMWRRIAIDAICDDPAWRGGDYRSEPSGRFERCQTCRQSPEAQHSSCRRRCRRATPRMRAWRSTRRTPSLRLMRTTSSIR